MSGPNKQCKPELFSFLFRSLFYGCNVCQNEQNLERSLFVHREFLLWLYTLIILGQSTYSGYCFVFLIEFLISYQTERVPCFLKMSDEIPRIPSQIFQLVNDTSCVKNCPKLSSGTINQWKECFHDAMINFQACLYLK